MPGGRCELEKVRAVGDATWRPVLPSLLDLLENGDEAPKATTTRSEQPAPVPPATTSSERRWPFVGQRRLTALVVAGLALSAGSVVAVQRIGDGHDQAQVEVITDDTDVVSDPVIDPAPTLPTIEPVPTTGPTAEPSPATAPVTATESKATTPRSMATATATAKSTSTAAGPSPSNGAPSSPNQPPVTSRSSNTIERVCRNSTDPACGSFEWDPEPAPNQPLEASFSHPATVAVGEVFVFEVVWADGDADLSYDHFSMDGSSVPAPCAGIARYGPWTPPAVTPASGTKRYRRRFEAAGTYDVVVGLRTGDCQSPYSSDLQIRTRIEVTGAPAPG